VASAEVPEGRIIRIAHGGAVTVLVNGHDQVWVRLADYESIRQRL